MGHDAIEKPATAAASSVALAGRHVSALTPVAASPAHAETATPAVVAPQAAAAAAPDDQTGTIVGSVRDQSGAVMPGATVTLTSTDPAVQRQTMSDGIGAFTFGNLQPARYAIAVALPGFDTITAVMTVQPRLVVGRSFALPIGVISESITVDCGTQAAASPLINGAAPNRFGPFSVSADRSKRDREAAVAKEVSLIQKAKALLYPTLSAQTPTPVRVGGFVQAPQKLTDLRPACPTVPRTDTTVVMVGRIGTDGALRGVRPLQPGSLRNGPTPPDPRDTVALQVLTQSAVEAVSGWTFTPARLNGQNVDIDVTIQVTFRAM
jgi:hypothetical protein